ncbi:hypothetical protein An09g02945 [Aspergillus niger]|uniref:Uncharacterized protein n=2 Tax=Aspergillus niger TaxID=5061 RepID=A2QTQ8_ASPNC|nr:hypothetical protein An09g02945 [Aspergillus niger]CAK40233.1 hypothetical protein An09g02945 [Aspergillus niger]
MAFFFHTRHAGAESALGARPQYKSLGGCPPDFGCDYVFPLSTVGCFVRWVAHTTLLHRRQQQTSQDKPFGVCTWFWVKERRKLYSHSTHLLLNRKFSQRLEPFANVHLRPSNNHRPTFLRPDE